MEKRLFQLILTITFIFSSAFLFSQTPDLDRTINLHVWAELDAYPELKEAQDTSSGQWDYPISRIKEVTPFLITGMVYGWNFTYTPYDKFRNVQEYFEITPISNLTSNDSKIIYEKPWIQDNKLNCWAKYNRTDNQTWTYRKWRSLNSTKIKGRGVGQISNGFDGITDAAKDSLKQALRQHYRALEKNKPKEITGRVIIFKEPKIGIVEGQYIVELDFFLETDRIVKYTVF